MSGSDSNGLPIRKCPGVRASILSESLDSGVRGEASTRVRTVVSLRRLALYQL